MTSILGLLVLSCCLAGNKASSSYRPLVLIHGVTSNHREFETLIEFVNEDFPGMLTFPINAYEDDTSIVDLNIQELTFAKKIRQITDEYGEITLLGYSQGGVIARSVVEKSSNPQINTFISLSSPTAGQYGIPQFLANDYPYVNLTRSEVYKTCYNLAGQAISACEYWNDPKRHEMYLNKNKFLPKYMNIVQHRQYSKFKENFSALSQLVLVGGPSDEVIKPWQSAQFGFYNENLDIVPMEQQEYFLHDTFGLKTLFERGQLATCTADGVLHTNWVRNYTVYENCIKPWLTE